MNAGLDRLRSVSGGWRVLPGAIAWVIVGLVMLAISAKFSPGTGDLLTTICGFICLAQSWNVIAGYGGQVSLGTSAFAGVGAYSAALVAIHLQLPATFMLLFGLVAGTLLALLLAVPLLRLRGDYFSIGTLVASLALQAWALNWSFVGGSTGLSLPLESLPAPLQVLRLSIVVATVSMLAAWTIAHSRVGLRLRAVRDDEGAARGVGVSGFLSRALALCVSGGLAGLAGALIAIQQISFEPTGMLGLGWTVSALLMTVVGGPGSVLGPVFGVVIVYWGLTKQLAGRESASIVIEGALLLLIVRFAPAGVWPSLVSLVRGGVARSRHQPSNPDAASAPHAPPTAAATNGSRQQSQDEGSSTLGA